jgi:hypothetical protein
MNARQKAKKYKKIAERYKNKAEAWDRYMRSEALKNVVRKYGTIETLKVAKYWDDRVPEEFLKKEISQDIAECLLREGYIDFKVNDNYNEYNMVRRVIATIKVTKVGESE